MTVVEGTTPYPWPWDGGLDPARLALLAVSCSHLTGWEQDHPVEQLAATVREREGLILSVRVRPPRLPRVRPSAPAAGARPTTDPNVPSAAPDVPSPDPDGAGANADLDAPSPDAYRPWAGDGGLRPDHVILAAGWDGFHGSHLDAVLRADRRDLLLLAGCCLETGVHSTMRAANDRGYECLLVADACTSVDPGLTAAALSTIEMSGGIFGAVGDSTAVANALHVLTTERTMS